MVLGSLPPGYFKFLSVAMLTMFAGAQVVHSYYKPLLDMDEWIEKEKQSMIGQGEKTEKSSDSSSVQTS